MKKSLIVFATAMLVSAGASAQSTHPRFTNPTVEGLSATVNDLTQALASANVRAANLATEVQQLRGELASKKTAADTAHDVSPKPKVTLRHHH